MVRNLQTLAESSQRLSADIKATEARIPWRELSGFRNVIGHDYLGLDLDAVWLVIAQDLPPAVLGAEPHAREADVRRLNLAGSGPDTDAAVFLNNRTAKG